MLHTSYSQKSIHSGDSQALVPYRPIQSGITDIQRSTNIDSTHHMRAPSVSVDLSTIEPAASLNTTQKLKSNILDLQATLKNLDLELRNYHEGRTNFTDAKAFDITQKKVEYIESIINKAINTKLATLSKQEQAELEPYTKIIAKAHIQSHIELLHMDRYTTLASVALFRIARNIESKGMMTSQKKQALLYYKMLQASPFGLMLYANLASSETFKELASACNNQLKTPPLNSNDVLRHKFSSIFLRTANKLKDKTQEPPNYSFAGIQSPYRPDNHSLDNFQMMAQQAIIDLSHVRSQQITDLAAHKCIESIDKNHQINPNTVNSLIRGEFAQEHNFIKRFFYLPRHLENTFKQIFDEVVNDISTNSRRPKEAAYVKQLSGLEQQDYIANARKSSTTFLNTIGSLMPYNGVQIDLSCNQSALRSFGFDLDLDNNGNSGLDHDITREVNQYLPADFKLNTIPEEAPKIEVKNIEKPIKRMEHIFDNLFSFIKNSFKR